MAGSPVATNGEMSFSCQMNNSYMPFPQQRRYPVADNGSCFIPGGSTKNIPNQSFFAADPNSTLYQDASFANTSLKIAELQAKLQRKLGPEYISTRPGPGGGPKLTYAEGWKIIELANEVFGFNGWNSSVVNLNTDFVDYSEETRRFNVGVSAIVRVTLRDGTFHEDVGYGMLENSRNKGAALDKCKKEAITDALKRALRNFGNLLGNCLYDKHYTQEIVKIKVPPSKLDKFSLHRRPEYEAHEEPVSNNKSNIASGSYTNSNLPPVVSKPPGASSSSTMTSKNTGQSRPVSAIPPHVRPVATSTPPRTIPRPQSASKTEKTTPHMNAQQASTSNAATASTALGQASNKPEGQVGNKPDSVSPSEQRDRSSPPILSQKVIEKLNSWKSQSSMHELDSFELYSLELDDDELTAALDQCESELLLGMEQAADMGRPIELDEGIGGAIKFDEGCAADRRSVSTDVESSYNETGVRPRDINEPQQQGFSNNATATDGSAKSCISSIKQARGSVEGHASGHGCGGVTNSADGVRDHFGESPEDEIARQILAIRQQRKRDRDLNPNAPKNQGQDHARGPASLGMTTRRTSAPSSASNGSGSRESDVRDTGAGEVAQAGMKRPAADMTGGSNSDINEQQRGRINDNTARPQIQAHNQNQGPRRPLAPLGMQDLHDPKRMKR